VYSWGEGANEQKTNKRKKRVCLVKARFATQFAIFCFFGGTRKIVYAKYTGFFRTRRENHNLIKILTFATLNFIKFSPFLGRIFDF